MKIPHGTIFFAAYVFLYPFTSVGTANAGDTDTTPLLNISGKVCTESPDLHSAKTLVLDRHGEVKTTIVFDLQSPCVENANAKSLYAVVALPVSTAPYAISISSTPQNHALFAPHAVFLTDAGAVSRELAGDSFTFKGEQLSALARSRPSESYLVIESDPSVVGHAMQRIAEGRSSVFTGQFTVYSGSDTKNYYELAHSGVVTVSIAPIPKD